MRNKIVLSSVVALSVVLGTFIAGGLPSSEQEAAVHGPKIQYNDEYKTTFYIAEDWSPKTKMGLSRRDIVFAYLRENSQKFKL